MVYIEYHYDFPGLGIKVKSTLPSLAALKYLFEVQIRNALPFHVKTRKDILNTRHIIAMMMDVTLSPDALSQGLRILSGSVQEFSTCLRLTEWRK